MSTKVQVATTVFNEPVPGILIDTDQGEVILIFEPNTGTMGIHAPDDMTMSHVADIIESVDKEYTGTSVNPFAPDDTAPLLFEEDFIFRSRDA